LACGGGQGVPAKVVAPGMRRASRWPRRMPSSDGECGEAACSQTTGAGRGHGIEECCARGPWPRLPDRPRSRACEAGRRQRHRPRSRACEADCSTSAAVGGQLQHISCSGWQVSAQNRADSVAEPDQRC